MLLAAAGAFLIYIFKQKRNRHWWYFGVAIFLFLPFVFSICCHAGSMFPMVLAHVTKIGNFKAERITIASKSCPAISAATGVPCDKSKDTPIQICNTYVMSRMGSEAYLRLSVAASDKKVQPKIVALFVPNSDIVAMQPNFSIRNFRMDKIDEELEKSTSACAPPLGQLHAEAVFGYNDYALSKTAIAELDPFVASIKVSVSRIREIRVHGYVDSTEDAEMADWLSMQRAIEVKLYLQHELQGIDAKLEIFIDTKPGSGEIVTTCAKAKDRILCGTRNRRAEITIVAKPDSF